MATGSVWRAAVSSFINTAGCKTPLTVVVLDTQAIVKFISASPGSSPLEHVESVQFVHLAQFRRPKWGVYNFKNHWLFHSISEGCLVDKHIFVGLRHLI